MKCSGDFFNFKQGKNWNKRPTLYFLVAGEGLGV